MKFTRLKTTVMAGVLAASMVLPGKTALAAGSQITKDNNGKVTTAQAQKTVTVADGVTTLPTADQSITIKVEQVDNATIDGKQQPKHEVTVENKTLSLTDSATNNAILGVADILSADEITAIKANPGEYTFVVSEDTTTLTEDADGFGWTQTDDSTYYLRVIVDNKTPQTVSYFLTEDQVSTDKSVKLSHADFANTYNKKSTDDDESDKLSALTVKMVVAGDGVDLTKTFPAEVEITAPSVSGNVKGDAYTAYVKDAQGNLTEITDAAAYVVDGKKVTIKANLKNGESIVVKNMAVGATYSFKDTYDESDSSFVSRDWTNNGSGKIGEESSNETITLTFKDLTVTGVVTDIAPYVTLVVLAGAAVVAYMALKRRVAR